MDSCTFIYETSFNDKTKCCTHEFSVREGIDLEEMLYEFEMFLQGAGYIMEGHLQFVESEEIAEAEEVE